MATTKCNSGSNWISKEKLSIFLNELSGFGAFLHIFFGTVVFSSVMFISTIDAVKVIARYVASGLECRLVITWELGGLKMIEGRA